MRSVADMYQAYGKRVFNLAYRMTGSTATAEDILHEVFIRVMTHAGSFRGDSDIYSWLFVITRNLCLRATQRSFRGFEKLIESSASSAGPAFGSKLERDYYAQEVKNGCLIGLLKCLSFYQRIAFVLCILYGLDTNTAAIILKKSENSVRILVSRARTALRTFLCRNCSLYDKANRCRCENMVQFSLQNSWIAEYDAQTTPAAIESELRDFKDEVLLYTSLLERDPPPDSMPTLLERNDFRILSRQKVK